MFVYFSIFKSSKILSLLRQRRPKSLNSGDFGGFSKKQRQSQIGWSEKRQPPSPKPPALRAEVTAQAP